jgi:hypothetical protein
VLEQSEEEEYDEETGEFIEKEKEIPELVASPIKKMFLVLGQF